MPLPRTVRVNLTIREDQKAFLDRHPEYNVSGILQAAIDKIMDSIGGGLTDRAEGKA